MSGIDRTEILRKDCPVCHGNGYVGGGEGETTCNECGGSGMIEIEVPFKFDGVRTPEEIKELFENTRRINSNNE